MTDSLRAVPLDRNAVITLQGGGLYGLTLLGQLSSAIEEVDPVAIAGTSAGAIIAALTWIGWAPRDLRNRLGCEARHRRLHHLPGHFEPPELPFDFRSWTSLTRDVAAAFAAMRRQRGGRIGTMINSAALLYNSWKLMADVRPHYRTRGVFSGSAFEEFVEKLLREGLAKRGLANELTTKPITFGDVDAISRRHPDAYFPPLVLAATNLGTQNVELINSLDERYSNVSVSKAVRASAGYPVFFRPVELGGLPDPAWFIDGGVISNFPAWAFSGEFRNKMYANEKYRALAYRPWLHVGLRLVERDTRHDGTGKSLPLFDFLELERPAVFASALTRLLLGEARNRLEDMISSSLARSVIVAQPFEESGGPSNLLDLDSMNERRVHNMFEAGASFAGRSLKKRSFEVRAPAQQLVTSLMASLTERVKAILDPGNKQIAFRVRSNVFLPSKSHLTLAFEVNMRHPDTGTADPDVMMEFDRPDQGLTGFCFVFRRPLICNLAQISTYVQDAGRTLFNMTQEQQGLVLTDRTWLASTPIFDPNDVIFRKSLLPDIEPWPEAFATQLGVAVDGPVFGVLNVDANLDYALAGLDADPNIHARDPRVAAALDMMSVSAARIGQILAREFASEGDRADG